MPSAASASSSPPSRSAFRNPPAWPPPYFGDARPDSAPELLALVPDDWVEDATALGSAFAERYPAWHGTGAVLNPTFAGSSGHRRRRCRSHHRRLSLGDQDDQGARCPGGVASASSLVTFCSTTRTSTLSIAWGCCCRGRIPAFSWPVRELIAELSGRDDLDLPILRERFRRVCEALRVGGDAG